ANYGVITINKAVTITSGGVVAGVLATSGAGIIVSAGANDNVILDGLDIDGGNTGAIGIQFNSGLSLNVRNTVIHNFTNSGIAFAPSGPSSLSVSNTSASNNAGSGIMVGGGTTGVAALSRIMAAGNGV